MRTNLPKKSMSVENFCMPDCAQRVSLKLKRMRVS
jgi:hypothetical protein